MIALWFVLLNPVQSTMGQKKRKLSDLTVGDRNSLLVALDAFQGSLDEDDEDLPSGLLSALGQFREKLEVVKVRLNALCRCKQAGLMICVSTCRSRK